MGLFIIEVNTEGNVIEFCFWTPLAATESEFINVQ